MSENLEKASHLSTVLTLALTVGTLLASTVWYIYRFDSRLESLEVQINTLGGAESAQQDSTVLQDNEGNSSDKPADLLLARCSDLANRAARAYEEGKSLSAGKPIEELMIKMGCIKSN